MKDVFPRADLIICRDCFIHYPFHHIKRALENLKASGSTYLLTSTSPVLTSNSDLPTPGLARLINFQLNPFNFPDPVALIEENEPGKAIGLWRLDSLERKA